MQTAPPTPKGFRDIDPKYAKKRREIISAIVPILESNGFVPIETPTIEFAQTLTGKYGDEEKLIYNFTDRGGRQLALRYDLTVPLARYIANNQNLLTPTFSRYQIGQVFRGENPQHGRYREFTQFDFDTLGPSGIEEDAKIIATAIAAVEKIGLKNAVMLINDRKSFTNIPADFIRALDKLHKIGASGVKEELISKGYKSQEIDEFLKTQTNKTKTNELEKLFSTLENLGVDTKTKAIYDPTLARGLDYYTGTIMELKPSNNPKDLTIGSGGRYDNLIGMFAKKEIPAIGFSFGLDRIVDLLQNA